MPLIRGIYLFRTGTKMLPHRRFSFQLIYPIKDKLALAGVAQWIECRPVDQKVDGSILRAHAWVVGPIPSWGV